jgi:hypothetical protein
MAMNLDKPHLWKTDTQASVDYYNKWFLKFAPKAFRDARLDVTKHVEQAIVDSNDARDLSADLLLAHPEMLPTLRMACCPPVAVDRLIGLAGVAKTLVKNMEQGNLSVIPKEPLRRQMTSIVKVLRKLLDPDIFVWVADRRSPTEQERYRASTIVADRLTGAIANPIIRNAQERRQLDRIAVFLAKRGYRKKQHPPGIPLDAMEPGTYSFHYPVVTGNASRNITVSVDVLIQPRVLRENRLPIMMEAKSAGDFTNTNKRRKEESKKFSQLKATFGDDVCYIVFLCGYFDSGYLGYEAGDGIDWVWEHRIDDLAELGI